MTRGGARVRATGLLAGLSLVAGLVTAVLAGPLATGATAPPITTRAADLPSMVSASPTACAPAVHGKTDVLATNKIDDEVQIGATMFAVGSFAAATPTDCTTRVTGTPVARSNVMAFTATTGALTSFAPKINGEVWSVLPSATNSLVYLCGNFTTADGVARHGLAKYVVATGKLDTAFDAHLNGACSNIVFAGGRLVVMGSFTKLGIATRVGLAVIANQNTGATDTGAGYFGATALGANDQGGITRIYRGLANPSATSLVVIGNFGTVGGKKRHQIAMLGLGATAATLSPWYNTGFDVVCRTSTGVYSSYLRDIAWSPDGNYFVVGGTGSPHAKTFCDSIERFDYAPTNTNQAPKWHMYTDGDTFHSIAITTNAVYYAGHMRYIDVTGPIWPAQPIPAGQPCDPHTPSLGTSGSPSSGGPVFDYGYNCPTSTATYRPGIGALNPSTGQVLSWNPQRSRNEGAKSLYVSTSPAGLWVGSDGAYGGCAAPTGPNHDDCSAGPALFVGGNAFFPLATTPVTPSPTAPTPTTSTSATTPATSTAGPTTSTTSTSTTAPATTAPTTTAPTTTAPASTAPASTTASVTTSASTSSTTAAASATPGG